MSTTRKITLNSFDSEAFKIDEAAVLESQRMKHMIDNATFLADLDELSDNEAAIPDHDLEAAAVDMDEDLDTWILYRKWRKRVQMSQNQLWNTMLC